MEKDPSLFMANANFLLAKDFLTLGDWRKSLFLAQETLSLDPHHTGALEIRSSWRKRIVREVFMGGISFVLLFWVLNTVWFVFVEPGVHKTLAVFVNGLVLLVVGFLAGLLILPVLFPIRLFRYRAVVLVGFFSLALWGGPSFFRREFHWDPIRFADQKALDQEMTQHFKFGVPEVYHAPDLGFLERLDTRYKSSRADKTWLNEALKRQRFLKAQKEEEQKKFDRTVADIIASNQSLKKKKDLLKKAEAMARLTQLNVTSSQNALTPVEKKENERAFKRLRQPPPRIRIGMGDQRR